MARTKSKTDNRQNGLKQKTAAPAKKAAPRQDESDSEVSDIEQYDIGMAGESDVDMDYGKDAAEEELERAVFGDSMGFRTGLGDFEIAQDEEDSAEEGAADEGDEDVYGGVADGDLFFTDVGASAALQPAPATEEDEEEEEGGAAWQDSDDERLLVSLASVPRLRKLRRTEAEDVISGKDYVRRLRKQYEKTFQHQAIIDANRTAATRCSTRYRIGLSMPSRSHLRRSVDSVTTTSTPNQKMIWTWTTRMTTKFRLSRSLSCYKEAAWYDEQKTKSASCAPKCSTSSAPKTSPSPNPQPSPPCSSILPYLCCSLLDLLPPSISITLSLLLRHPNLIRY